MTKPKVSYLSTSQDSKALWKRQQFGGGEGQETEQNRRQQEKRKAKCEVGDSIQEATDMRLQELSWAAEDRTVCTPLIHRVARSQS